MFSRFSFWIQLFFGAVSGIVLLFAMLGRNMSEQTHNAGIGFGVLLAIVGLLLLCFRIFGDFRDRFLGRLLHAENSQVEPSKEHITHTLRVGLISSWVGVLIAFVASEETVAVVLAKTLSQPQALAAYTPENVARNILAKGLKQAGISLNTVGHTEINAWGQNLLYSLVVTSTSKSTDPSKNPRTFRRLECQIVRTYAPIKNSPSYQLD